MRVPTSKPLLARTPRDRFIGRDDELERLYLRAIASGGRPALHVEAAAAAGLSELLRQVYDRAFAEQRFVVPFYYSVRSEDVTAHAAAARYQYQFLLQAVAFRRQQSNLVAASPDICELSKLAPLQDAEWVNQMCEVCRNDGPLNDERAFIRTALNAPFRAAAAADLQIVSIVDDLHELEDLKNGNAFRSELVSIAERANVPLIIGSRKNALPLPQTSERLEIRSLNRSELADLGGLLASDAGIETSEQTLDLIAAKFAGRPLLIEILIEAARSKGVALQSYKDVEKLYSDEILSGRLGSHYERIFGRAVPDLNLRQALYNELFQTVGESNAQLPLTALQKRLVISDEKFSGIIEKLASDEVVEKEGADIRLAADAALNDFLAARYRSSASRRTPTAVAALTVTTALKRAPRMMSRLYRRDAAIGLADILLRFDVQDVPRSLIDFRIFREELAGLSETEMREKAFSGEDIVTLPQIVHAAPISDHFPEFGSAEPERSVAGIGFKDQQYGENDEIAWFAAEIDSKLEADASLTQEWCDRLADAADALGYRNYRIWLVSPEGFSDGALDNLADRNGFGSSRRQAELLREFLSGAGAASGPPTAVFEVVIPTGGEAELVAAHALEEIARRNEFPAKTVNQIKTAVVEACINVSEHSLSPDGKIHLKFAVSKERITITVSNRGLRLTDKTVAGTADEQGRRGWGLGLIRNLMDEVRVVPVDDGSRIEMTKYLEPAKKNS